MSSKEIKNESDTEFTKENLKKKIEAYGSSMFKSGTAYGKSDYRTNGIHYKYAMETLDLINIIIRGLEVVSRIKVTEEIIKELKNETQ